MYFTLLGILFLLTVIGLISYRSWLNPVSIFNVVWLVVCFLYGFRLSPNLQAPLENRTCYLLMLGNIIFTISCIVVSKISIWPTNLSSVYKTKEITFENIQKHFWIWFVLELFETVYSKGFPIIWALQHNGKTYFDYGIPSVHGFANAYGLTILTILAYQLFKGDYKKQSKKIVTYILIILLMYVFMLTRQVIISAIIQIFVVYCFLKRKIPWVKILIWTFLIIIVFGLVGNIRTGYYEFLSVAQMDTKVNPLFVGFYWVYMYLTMTIANLNKLFNMFFTPLGMGYFWSIYLPTALVNSVFKFNNPVDQSNFLVTQAFNVSGYSADAYISIGIMGIVIMAIIYGIIGGLCYKKIIRNRSMKNILYYAVYLQIIVLSFFFNQLFYLPSGFQFVIIYFLFKNIKSKGKY
ncbi:O-antigen polymerase [Lactobacillus helveticus]|uniref:O-antigen polymerase n=1 Tax=Lactobacillus helveticus TaxID=1587 RepID=UPI000E57EFCE|nr:O-antigen polymerase [Lactobacillus helveticus]RHX78849.1 hypothetical protein DSY27_07205 [Lactobacillus helveticus]